MSKKARFVASMIVGLALVALAVGVMLTSPEVSLVEAEVWATPQGAAFGGGDWAMVPYLNAASVITPAGLKWCGTGMQTAAYVLADCQTIYDEHSANIVTCTMEFSNDNTNWCTNMGTVTETVTADGVSCEELHLFGRYSRVCCIASETELYTITVRAKVFN